MVGGEVVGGWTLGLTAHHVGRRTRATLLGENGTSEAELLASHGWRTQAMAHRYVKRNLGLSQVANKRMPLPTLTGGHSDAETVR